MDSRKITDEMTKLVLRSAHLYLNDSISRLEQDIKYLQSLISTCEELSHITLTSAQSVIFINCTSGDAFQVSKLKEG